MSYTEMWSNISSPETRGPYSNLTQHESGYMDTLAFAITQWPEEYQCQSTVSHGHIQSDSWYGCHYRLVLNAFNDLHRKEYGE